jgi:ribonuclease R
MNNPRPPKRPFKSSAKFTPRPAPGMPNAQQVLDFIASATGEVGKREIAKHFGLQGQEKIQLKALLKDMAEEGLIDGKRTAYHRMGGVPKVTVLRVIEIEDGEPVAVPDTWEPEDNTPAPRLRIIEPRGGGKARRSGCRSAARGRPRAGPHRRDRARLAGPSHEEAARPGRPDHGRCRDRRRGQGLAGPHRQARAPFYPIADLGGAEEGQLVLAEPVSKSPRAGCG